MKKQISIAADLGASGGKMARGSFNGEHLEIGDYFDFPNQPLSLNRNLYWDLFDLYKSILKGIDYYSKEQGAVLIRGGRAMDFWIKGDGFWSLFIITGICGRNSPLRSHGKCFLRKSCLNSLDASPTVLIHCRSFIHT